MPVPPVLVAADSGQTVLSELGWLGDKCWGQSWVLAEDPLVEVLLMLLAVVPGLLPLPALYLDPDPG